MRALETIRALVALACLFCLVSLTACGGGGGGGGEGGVDPVVDGTGIFGFPAVKGLAYETPTMSGLTDADGRFFFEPGENVTFSIGGTVLGTTRGKARITPFDLIPDAEVPTTNSAYLAMQNGTVPTPGGMAANMVVFLLTIDTDGDPANGVEVPNGVTTLLNGVQIPFNRSIWLFRESTPLRRLIRDGIANGLWGGVGRAIPHTAIAMDAFLSTGGYAHSYERVYRSRNDEDGNGVLDSSYSVAYSSDALTIEEFFDMDGNGTTDRSGRASFREEGSIHQILVDMDNDGATDRVSIFDYDDNGNMERYSSYDNAVLDRLQTRSLNSFGQPFRDTTDNDGDGNADEITVRYRNAQGAVIRRTRDEDANGTLDYIVITTRYPNQSIETQSTDRDGDGTVDYKRYYDTKGRTVRLDRDLNDDGAIDEREVWIYDDVNRVMRFTRDSDMDGNPESKSELRYDAEGRDIDLLIDVDADGNWDERRTWTYLADRTVMERDEGNDGSIDLRSFELRNAAGNIYETRTDEGADGTFESIYYNDLEPGTPRSILRDDL